MTRPPPLPPLFPYTTLFRSQQSGTSRRYEVQMSAFPARLVIDTYHGRAIVQKSDSRSLIATPVIQLNSGTRGTTFHSLAHHLWVRHWTNNNSVDALLVHDDQLMNLKYILLRLRFLSRLGLPCPCGQQ